MLQRWFDNFRDLAELQAQIDAAYWTKVSAIATAVSILVSALALIGLFLSLRQTTAALQEARESRKDAKVASESAIAQASEANNISRAAYSAELRPWLVVDDVKIDGLRLVDHNGDVEISIAGSYRVKNIGKSPAFRMIMAANALRSVSEAYAELNEIRNFFEGNGVCLLPGTSDRRIFATKHVLPSLESSANVNLIISYFQQDSEEEHITHWISGLRVLDQIVNLDHRLNALEIKLHEPFYVDAS
jgi:hypothetical protein